MEKAKFKEAKKQSEIIFACECVLDVDIYYEKLEDSFEALITNRDPHGLIVRLLATDKQVRRSFLRWVANEKEIAEKKFKEI